MVQNLKNERRWQVRKLIILVNLMVLGLSFYMDYVGIKAEAFQMGMNGFQGASAFWFSADYLSKPSEN